jgi:hypothetical protein
MTDEEEYDIEESAAAAAGTRRRRRPSSTDSFRTAPGRNSSFGLSAEVRANRCGAAADIQNELSRARTHAGDARAGDDGRRCGQRQPSRAGRDPKPCLAGSAAAQRRA